MTATVRVQSFPREEFITRRFHYRAGDHVTFVAPTQAGKTTFAFQLMDEVSSPKVPAVVLVMKPRDPVPARLTREVGYRVVRHWPPVKRPWANERGWTLWPAHTFDPKIDDPRLATEFRRAILDNYKRGNRITFGDEVYGLGKLGLSDEMEAVWTRGSGMGNALWAASQRPRGIPLLAYSSAEHLFLGSTPDKQDRDRYAEIGGVDPDLVKQITAGMLRKYQWLYIRRTGPAMCIVEA